MKCSQARDLIPQYCRGELDDDTRREVEKHISGCPDCRKEMEQERSLGQVLGQSAADDPPDEYWESYNAKVRSRARAATGMFWRLGMLPGCLAGALIAIPISLVVTYTVVWLLRRHGLREVHPGWLRSTLEVLIVLGVGAIAMVPTYRAVKSLVWRINNRSIPRYEGDESSLKRAIAANPVYRRVFMIAIMTVYTGYCVYFPIYAWGTWFKDLQIPRWAISLFRDVMMIGFIATIPAFHMQLRGYFEGPHLLAEWAVRYRKAIRFVNILAYVGISTMGIGGIWSLINSTR